MIDAVLSGVFLVSALGILGGLLVLLARLRAGNRAPSPVPADGGGWVTFVAGLALTGLMIAAVALLTEAPPPSPPALVVKLTGYQFGWKFDYQQAGKLLRTTTDHLVLPRGVDTLILATSTDVIHRLEIPEFRVKRDLIPGLVSEFVVHPSRPGEFVVLSDGLCGELLGLMAAPVTVLEAAAFQEWLGLGILEKS